MTSTEETVMQMAQTLARLEQKIDSYCTMSLDHDHFINGNGSPGAKVEIDRIKQVIRVGKWVGGIIGGVLLTGVASGAMAMAVWWIKNAT
jgi:hypothetical protein